METELEWIKSQIRDMEYFIEETEKLKRRDSYLLQFLYDTMEIYKQRLKEILSK